MGWAPELNELQHCDRPSGPPPPNPTPLEDDEMIMHLAHPNRGFAVIGAGYYKPLVARRRVCSSAGPLVTKTLVGL
jgi:hypothetical protein